MNTQQNKALHKLFQKVRLTITKLGREDDTTFRFKDLLKIVYVIGNINWFH